MIDNLRKNSAEHPPSNSVGSVILRVLAFFVILEPVWMLLPFAGFLYGSVMHIETLSANPWTARLVHFVLPVHTLFPLGLLLIIAGCMIFLIGAFQIYAGKIARSGLVRTGIYRKFRHPQYLALALFGLGIILTWGRLLTFIAYFIMLWLYYLLAGAEERRCRELFGAEYDAYRDHTYFLLPGEKAAGAKLARFKPAGLPAWAAIALSFCLVLTMATVTGLLILELRSAFRTSLPAVTAAYPLPGRGADAVPLLLVKGPALQAAPVERVRNRFLENCLEMVLASEKVRNGLAGIEPGGNSTLLVFPTPGRNWYSAAHRDSSRAEVDLLIFWVKSPVPYRGGNLRQFRRNWRIDRLLRVENMSYGRLRAGLDPVTGRTRKERFMPQMEERIDFFLSGL
ncbi:MAG: isoprenylcysteine carboxylmethyltransferase family protein [Desulfurivibrionaceae bacterium]